MEADQNDQRPIGSGRSHYSKTDTLVSWFALGVVAMSIGVSSAAASEKNPSGRVSEPAASEQAKAIAPPSQPTSPSIIDYGIDNAMNRIREIAKKKKLPIDLLLDLAERAYRIARNERELAMWRREARRMLLELNLLAEGLDAEVERATHSEEVIQQQFLQIDVELKDLYEAIRSAHIVAQDAKQMAEIAHVRIDATERALVATEKSCKRYERAAEASRRIFEQRKLHRARQTGASGPVSTDSVNWAGQIPGFENIQPYVGGK